MSNLFKVETATDLDDILNNHRNKITVVGFMQDWVDVCKEHKRYFKLSAKSYAESLFILIDLSNFVDTNKRYLAHLQNVIPDYRFFHDNKQIAWAAGPDYKKVNTTLQLIISKWNAMQAASEPDIKPIVEPEVVPKVVPEVVPEAEQFVGDTSIPQQLLQSHKKKRVEMMGLQRQLTQLQIHRNKQQAMLVRQMNSYDQLYREKKKREDHDDCSDELSDDYSDDSEE